MAARRPWRCIQGYVQNQGDGWDYTLNYLERFFEDTSRDAAARRGRDVHGGYLALARTLGVRTAELHAAFARGAGDPAFEPVPLVPLPMWPPGPSACAGSNRTCSTALARGATRCRNRRVPTPSASSRSAIDCSR